MTPELPLAENASGSAKNKVHHRSTSRVRLVTHAATETDWGDQLSYKLHCVLLRSMGIEAPLGPPTPILSSGAASLSFTGMAVPLPLLPCEREEERTAKSPLRDSPGWLWLVVHRLVG
jgi:hypothetical protein